MKLSGSALSMTRNPSVSAIETRIQEAFVRSSRAFQSASIGIDVPLAAAEPIVSVEKSLPLSQGLLAPTFTELHIPPATVTYSDEDTSSQFS